MSLDAPTRAYLDRVAGYGAPPLSALGPVRARAVTAQMAKMFRPGPEVHARTEIPIGGSRNPALLLTPVPGVRAVIVYFHGGGWVLGAPEEYEAFGRTLAVRTGCAVLLPAYRLAPEHPFPAAVEDAWAALQWAKDFVAERGEGARLILAGDSAGANLAGAMSRRAREAGAPNIARQILAYPIVDADFDTASYQDPRNQLIFDRDLLRWFWDQYQPDPALRSDPSISLTSGDLAGLPPTAILVAEHDVLRSEAETFAECLRQVGVPVSLQRFPGQAHGFLTMIGILPASAQGLDYLARQVDEALSEAPR